MTDPFEPKRTPTWVNAVLVVLAVLIIAVGACFVLLADLG